MMRLTAAELELIREALNMAALRHESYCRWQIKKPRRTQYGANHERIANRMRELIDKLADGAADAGRNA